MIVHSFVVISVAPLLTWFNFNPNKSSHAQSRVEWNYLSILKNG